MQTCIACMFWLPAILESVVMWLMNFFTCKRKTYASVLQKRKRSSLEFWLSTSFFVNHLISS
uniref:Uncharacterized protein n=1 Tax=Arundo donax TaxID=35708 RepID=A0A0A9EFE6_ARUDO